MTRRGTKACYRIVRIRGVELHFISCFSTAKGGTPYNAPSGRYTVGLLQRGSGRHDTHRSHIGSNLTPCSIAAATVFYATRATIYISDRHPPRGHVPTSSHVFSDVTQAIAISIHTPAKSLRFGADTEQRIFVCTCTTSHASRSGTNTNKYPPSPRSIKNRRKIQDLLRIHAVGAFRPGQPSRGNELPYHHSNRSGRLFGPVYGVVLVLDAVLCGPQILVPLVAGDGIGIGTGTGVGTGLGRGPVLKRSTCTVQTVLPRHKTGKISDGANT